VIWPCDRSPPRQSAGTGAPLPIAQHASRRHLQPPPPSRRARFRRANFAPPKKSPGVQRRSFPQVHASARARGASWGSFFHRKRERWFRRGLFPRGTAATLFCSKPMQRALRTGKRTLAHFSPADTIWLSFRRTNSPSDRGRHASRLSGTLATNTTRCACDSTVTPLVTASAPAAGHSRSSIHSPGGAILPSS